MRNRLVPHAEWRSFFRGFSERHEDCLVTVRVLSPALGSQIAARDLPLEGIVSGPAVGSPIAISLGRAPERHVEHVVEEPKRVWVELSEEGAEAALEIESNDGAKTILQFRSAPPPLEVNGILHP
jgi:Family of unknown function (DUF5335)